MKCRWCPDEALFNGLCRICFGFSGEDDGKDPFRKEILSKKSCGCAFWRDGTRIVEGKCKLHKKER